MFLPDHITPLGDLCGASLYIFNPNSYMGMYKRANVHTVVSSNIQRFLERYYDVSLHDELYLPNIS
jgi:hypothetical protein